MFAIKYIHKINPFTKELCVYGRIDVMVCDTKRQVATEEHCREIRGFFQIPKIHLESKYLVIVLMFTLYIINKLSPSRKILGMNLTIAIVLSSAN